MHYAFLAGSNENLKIAKNRLMQKFCAGDDMLKTLSSKVVPSKPGTGPYIAMHATLTARDFFPASFYSSGPADRTAKKALD